VDNALREPIEFPVATAEETADAVFQRNKKLVEGTEPFMEAMDAIADEHDMMERKYAALDRRLKAVERRGTFLPDINDEKILFYLAAAYLLIQFVVPAVMNLINKGEGEIS
jgi:hypothetical protein